MTTSESTASSQQTGLRARLRAIVEHPTCERVIMVLIVVNAITLGLETSERAMAVAGPALVFLDKTILGIFVVEITARLIVKGRQFFKDGWCLFDFFVVGIALVPATGNLSVLRALRILRALRLISTVKSMRNVVTGLLHAIPGMGSIVLLLVLLFYVFSVMATKLFGDRFPEWFGTIGGSAYSLFQIMTLESWSMGIVRPVMEVYPWAWAFFVPFILMTSFTVLNLFIGIIVDAMQSQHQDDNIRANEEAGEERHQILDELTAMRSELAALNQRLDAAGKEGSEQR